MQNLLGAIQILKLLFFASVDLSQVRTSVTIIQSRHDLGKDLPDEVLVYGVLLLNALADDLLQVPVLAVLHNDVDLQILFVDEVLQVLHNSRVLKFAQNIDFSYDLLLFLFIHLPII